MSSLKSIASIARTESKPGEKFLHPALILKNDYFAPNGTKAFIASSPYNLRWTTLKARTCS